jgi:hypothetical protein
VVFDYYANICPPLLHLYIHLINWMTNGGIYLHILELSTCATYLYWHFSVQPAIGIVLGFIGTKMIFDFFGEQLEILLNSYFVTFIYNVFTLFVDIISISRTHGNIAGLYVLLIISLNYGFPLLAGYHLPTEASLAIVTTCLSGGVILSLRKASKEEMEK